MIKILQTQKNAETALLNLLLIHIPTYSSNILLPENPIEEPFPPIYEMGFASIS